MKLRRYFALLGILLSITSFAQKNDRRHEDVQLLTDHVFNLSEVMLHDVANPPAASRFYAYAMLGAYENRQAPGSYKSLVEPSVFNMSLLLPPTLVFLQRLRQLVFVPLAGLLIALVPSGPSSTSDPQRSS